MRALGEAERVRGVYNGCLQPIDTDRFAVAHVVLVADVDIVAGLDHLLGCLGEIGFVAIDRRYLKEPRQKRDQRDQNERE